MGGRSIRGNSVAEAISLGSLAIMNRNEVIHKELIIDECNVKSMDEAVSLIDKIERNPELYRKLLDKQRAVVDRYFFEAPLQSLSNCLTEKRNNRKKCRYGWFDRLSDRLCFFNIK